MENLKDLDTLTEQYLEPAFVKVGKDFTNFILSQVREKYIRGKSVNGRMFAELTKQYIDAIEKGNVNIESSFDFVLKAENNKAVKAAITIYESVLNSLEFPLPLDKLNEYCKDAEDAANKVFIAGAILTTDDGRSFSRQLAEQIISKKKSVSEHNGKISEENCIQILKQLYEPINAKMIEGKFTKSGGSKEYSLLLESIKTDFDKKEHGVNKGPRADQVLANFLKVKTENQLKKLVQTDKALT